MNKRKPTYDFEAFKAVAGTLNGLSATGSAIRGAAAVGCGRTDIVATIRTMLGSQFYKVDDVPRRPQALAGRLPRAVRTGLLYVKFTADAVTEFLLLSFKEKDND